MESRIIRRVVSDKFTCPGRLPKNLYGEVGTVTQYSVIETASDGVEKLISPICGCTCLTPRGRCGNPNNEKVLGIFNGPCYLAHTPKIVDRVIKSALKEGLA